VATTAALLEVFDPNCRTAQDKGSRRFLQTCMRGPVSAKGVSEPGKSKKINHEDTKARRRIEFFSSCLRVFVVNVGVAARHGPQR
jgi:hypothetical protein